MPDGRVQQRHENPAVRRSGGSAGWGWASAEPCEVCIWRGICCRARLRVCRWQWDADCAARQHLSAARANPTAATFPQVQGQTARTMCRAHGAVSIGGQALQQRVLTSHGGIAAEADPLRSPLVGLSVENRGPVHVTVGQLLPGFVPGRAIRVGEEDARAAKRQNTRWRLRRCSMTVLAGGGVVVRGRGRRVDLLGLASSLKRRRPPSRPAGTARRQELGMQVTLRRRLRLPPPLACCGGHFEPGCRAHRAACARSGLLARRAPYSSEHGFESRGKPSPPKGGWSPNNGLRGPPRRAEP